MQHLNDLTVKNTIQCKTSF